MPRPRQYVVIDRDSAGEVRATQYANKDLTLRALEPALRAGSVICVVRGQLVEFGQKVALDEGAKPKAAPRPAASPGGRKRKVGGIGSIAVDNEFFEKPKQD